MFKIKIGKRKPCRYFWWYLCYFAWDVLDDVIRDIMEGDVWYCSHPNLLLLGPNKIGTALGTRGRVASESACPLILFVEGQWFVENANVSGVIILDGRGRLRSSHFDGYLE